MFVLVWKFLNRWIFNFLMFNLFFVFPVRDRCGFIVFLAGDVVLSAR